MARITFGLRACEEAMAGRVVKTAPMSDAEKAAATPTASDLTTLRVRFPPKLASDYISQPEVCIVFT
jgi:hypothetical protein